jgi:ribosomal protein S21
MALIRRFSKRVQGAGIVRKVKSIRYKTRNQSRTRRRTSALRRITKQEKNATLERMGLLKPRPIKGMRK